MDHVWVITFINDNDETVAVVFEKEEDARICYNRALIDYCASIDYVNLDKYPINKNIGTSEYE